MSVKSGQALIFDMLLSAHTLRSDSARLACGQVSVRAAGRMRGETTEQSAKAQKGPT
jgi:hypothetical protein